MYTDIVSQFYDGIIPAYEQYVELSKKKDNKKSLLLNTATDVAGKLFHFRDELEPEFPPKTFKRSDVAALCPDFDWVGDVFNATKHKELDRASRIIKDKTHIDETIVWTYFPYEQEPTKQKTYYSTVQERVIVTPIEGRGKARDLLEITTNVLNFWSDFLFEKGMTKMHLQFKYDGDDVIPVNLLDAQSGNIPLKADGTAMWYMIARFYDPTTKTFKRWGFNKDGAVNTGPEVSDHAHNAIVRGHYKPDAPV